MGSLRAVDVTPAPKRLAALFAAAVVGVLAAIGLVVEAIAGPVGAVLYVAVVLGLVALGVQQVRRRLRAAAAVAAGRTCTCCTGTVHDPVQVI